MLSCDERVEQVVETSIAVDCSTTVSALGFGDPSLHSPLLLLGDSQGAFRLLPFPGSLQVNVKRQLTRITSIPETFSVSSSAI